MFAVDMLVYVESSEILMKIIEIKGVFSEVNRKKEVERV